MITKEQYLDLVKKEWGKSGINHHPNKLLFDTQFMAFLEKNFIQQDEIINITHSYNCGSGKFFDSWNEETFKGCLRSYIHTIVSSVQNKHSFYIQEYWIITRCICDILENNLYKKWKSSNNKPIDDKYKGFYSEKDLYGYYGMPFYLYIMNYYGWLDLLIESDKYGFDTEEEIVFDMNQWKSKFKDSKQITMLKNEYDPGWTENDWTYNEDGTLNEEENKYKNWNRETQKYWDGKTPHNYYDKYMYQIRKISGSNCLRKVDTGWSYISEAIDLYGYTVAFNGIYPIKKLKTNLGFSFYKQSGFWSDGVYCDDISIKKIKFPITKPTNLKLMDHERVFIVHNTNTGYWVLPKLYYPVKFKNLIKDILKKNKSIIGPWSETVVYADSRTLNGKGYAYYDDYPDIEDIETFKKIYGKIALRKMKAHVDKLKAIGGNINIEMPNNDDWIKPLNIITQNDINEFCNPNQETEIEIEKYDV